jgi:hypothetical protein
LQESSSTCLLPLLLLLLLRPGPRCQHDSAVLPNGKVLLIGGVEEGFSGLGYFPVSGCY